MHYIALGDSISIDDYPQRETGRRGLGAASLFFRNDDRFWPEFAGRDLSTLYPGATFQNLTFDGATSEDVLRGTLKTADLITLTAGGNDMLMHLRAPCPPKRLVEDIVERIDRILSKLTGAVVFLGTVYDPSDGTNVLYGERLDREAKWLAQFNESIRNFSSDNVRIIDIHKHFLGHGVSVPERERWYWDELIFEPNARGASEVRRLWLEALL